jgi:Lon protease-like protein
MQREQRARRALPVRPNLEHLKSQAKDLLDALRRKEPEALERFREALPAARGADDTKLAAMELALHDAQSVIAREYGFASWAELRAHVEAALPTPELLRALISPHMSAALTSEVQEALLNAMSEETPKDISLSSPLPLVPLRNAVLAVGAVAPLNIGRASSIAAVEAARDGEKLLAVFAQKEDVNEAPSEADLHPVGCAVRLLSVIPTQDRGLWIVVQATQWVRLEAIERRTPCMMARVSRFAIEEQETGDVKRLEQALRERVKAAMVKLPNAEHLRQRTERMSALELADITIANIECSVQEKATYAGKPSLVDRLEYVLALFDRAA